MSFLKMRVDSAADCPTDFCDLFGVTSDGSFLALEDKTPKGPVSEN
jgi:hypothetical protein